MREIEFRGKREDNGEWVFGDYGRGANGSAAIKVLWPEDEMPEGENQWTIYEVIPETVGQYTGLKDKNDVMIFEGDIVKICVRDWRPVGVVRYYDKVALYGLDVPKHPYIALKTYNKSSMEIIGNIHDAPDLVGQEETQ
jgi:uncharacterized phage protein (TIGR01671 family)